METSHLARLERVDLREAGHSEAGDFSPWLADARNIALLGETIGVELEVEAQERNVGLFRADILCKDTITAAADPARAFILISLLPPRRRPRS